MRQCNTVLLVHSDLGFIFWLGRTLEGAGYDAYPAKSVADALSLLSQARLSIDALILGRVTGAADLVDHLRNMQDMRVIAVVDDPDGVAWLPGAHATCAKPAILSEQTNFEWLQVIEQA